jgi:hypothetical protein
MRNDTEWNVTSFTNYKSIVGYFAMWSVRQLEVSHLPPEYATVVEYLSASLRINTAFDDSGWAHLTLNDIEKMLRDILMDYPPFQRWNNFEVLADWLDLDALIRNVAVSLRDENRRYEEEERRRV